METNLKAIVPLNAATGVDFSAALGCAVGADGALGGDYGVLVVVDRPSAGGTTSTSGSVALFGGNTGPVEVKLAGTVTGAGVMLKRNTVTGTWTAAATTDVAEARSLEGGTATELISAILLPPAAAVGASVFAAGDHDHDESYEPLGS
jgi:hypothetical protein